MKPTNFSFRRDTAVFLRESLQWSRNGGERVVGERFYTAQSARALYNIHMYVLKQAIISAHSSLLYNWMAALRQV